MHKYPQNNRKLRPPLGELGMHFEAILGVLGGSWGFLGRLEAWSWRILAPRRVLGGVRGGSWAILVAQMAPNLGPKMASSWGLDRTKIDANIARISDAFENRNLDGKSRFLNRKIMFLGLHLG